MFIVSDILSFLPASITGLAPPLQIGQQLPPEVKGHLKNNQVEGPTMIYVPRHCGCPFPERDLHHLYTFISRNIPKFESADARIIVLPHASTPEACQKWFDQVFSAAAAANSDYSQQEQQIKSFFHVIPDPAPGRVLAKSLSFGSLSFRGLLSKEPLSEALELRTKAGIKNRETAAGSNRWTEHGAVWASSGHDGNVVRWVEKPTLASGECNWAKGWKEVGIQAQV